MRRETDRTEGAVADWWVVLRLLPPSKREALALVDREGVN